MCESMITLATASLKVTSGYFGAPCLPLKNALTLELKLYMHRFLHDLDGLHNMSMLVFPKCNQYDGFIERYFFSSEEVEFQYDHLR